MKHQNKLNRDALRDVIADIRLYQTQGMPKRIATEIVTGDYRLSTKTANQLTNRYYKPQVN